MSLTDDLRSAPPGLHGQSEFWGLAWESLAFIERTVRPGMATLETGAGASTIVFTASGAEHEAVTPSEEEADRILAECERRGISTEKLTFRIGSSADVLRDWEPRELDLVLVDGAHAFPYPTLDWWYLAPHLKLGGLMLLDDAYMPPVAAVVDHVRDSKAWRLEDPISFRTAVADLTTEFGDIYSGRTVLVTGADGFMGSHLTDALCHLGADVHAFVRATSSGALNNIGHLRRKLTVHFADLTDKTSVD